MLPVCLLRVSWWFHHFFEDQETDSRYRSITEAELRAMASATSEVTWLCWLLKDFGVFAAAAPTLL
jgi:hypothetical protein